MTNHEKTMKVIQLSEEHDYDTVVCYLDFAKSKILDRLFPLKDYDPETTEIPEKYDNLQIEIAIYLLNKRGAEGETSHSENGTSRIYESADVPDSMLRNVYPYVKVF